MTNSENRILRLEAQIRTLLQQVQDLQIKVGQVAQNQYASGGSGAGTSGGGGNFICVLSSGLSASGVPGSGSPAGPVTGQTTYDISGGAFLATNTNASIYNGMPDAISSGKTVIVTLNADSTFKVIAVAC